MKKVLHFPTWYSISILITIFTICLTLNLPNLFTPQKVEIERIQEEMKELVIIWIQEQNQR